MNKRNYSIRDIAALAGVSASAVSYVLHNKPGVSEATRKRVKEVLKKYNYTGQRVKEAGKSFLIHLIIDNRTAAFDDMFYTASMIGIIEQCRRYDYNVVLTNITTDRGYLSLKRSIKLHNIDGAILLQNVSEKTYAGLNLFDIPFVVLDAHCGTQNCPSVGCDYTAAAKKAVDYLLATGHKKIAYLGRSDVPSFHAATLAGYRQALGADGDGIALAETDAVSVSLAVRKLLAADRPDAIFCACDMLAVYAMEYLQSSGVRVPEDIAVCSIDNIPVSQFCSPPLTTVDIDKKKMGETAVDLLMEMIWQKKPPHEVENRILPPGKIMERASVSNK